MRNEVLKFFKLLNNFETYLKEYINFCKNEVKEKQLYDLILLVDILEKSEIVTEKYIIE